jgi:hypothetical protein
VIPRISNAYRTEQASEDLNGSYPSFTPQTMSRRNNVNNLASERNMRNALSPPGNTQVSTSMIGYPPNNI